MDDGLQGIFILLIVVFWVLEAIVSARRKRQGTQEPVKMEAPEDLSNVPAGAEGPAALPGRDVWQDGHDQRDDYRALPGRPSGRPMTYGERHGEVPSTGGVSVPEKSQQKAAGMIPRDLWEELGALARGERAAPTEPPPSPSPVGSEAGSRDVRPGVGTEAEDADAARKRDGYALPTRRRAPAPAQPRRDVVGSDAAMAARVRHTPALRLSPEDSPRIRRGGTPGGTRPSGIVRSLAGGVTVRELRRAVILHEILGPPVALRGVEWEAQEGEGVRRPGLG